MVVSFIGVALVGLISLGCFAFWVWMLIDCLSNEPSEGSDKVVWALVLILLPFIGALIYFFVRRPQRAELYRA